MNHCCSDHHTHGFAGVLKRRCHSCKCEIAEALSVPCRSDHCHKIFCQKCLTSRYKYSKAKAATLPTLNWKCPVCTQRCFCVECVEAGRVARKRKPIYKRNIYTTRRRTKKRPRPKRRDEAQSLPSKTAGPPKCRVCGNVRKESGSMSGACTLCAGSNEASPRAPSIENATIPFSFGQALAFKDAKNETQPFKMTLAVRGLIYPEEVYATMPLMECLKIAFTPFSQHATHFLN